MRHDHKGSSTLGVELLKFENNRREIGVELSRERGRRGRQITIVCLRLCGCRSRRTHSGTRPFLTWGESERGCCAREGLLVKPPSLEGDRQRSLYVRLGRQRLPNFAYLLGPGSTASRNHPAFSDRSRWNCRTRCSSILWRRSASRCPRIAIWSLYRCWRSAI